MPKFKDLKEQLLRKASQRGPSTDIVEPEPDIQLSKSKNLNLDITKLYQQKGLIGYLLEEMENQKSVKDII